MAEKSDRRSFLQKTALGAAGLGAAYSFEEKILLAAIEDGSAGPQAAAAGDESDMPRGKIGDVSISRLFLGGNLIGGWAHARDLTYVSSLFKAYNTDEKIFETLALAEQSGINTILIDPASQQVVETYKRDRGGKIQTMVCFHPDTDEAKMADEIKFLVHNGATLLYSHGEVTDRLTMAGRVDVLAKGMELVKKEGVPAGIGSHSLETPIACEKQNVNPDYYVKTFHMDRYWSATPEENRKEWCWYNRRTGDHNDYNDNMFCLDPDRTARFMQTVEKPWVAFKTMAAGAIHPRKGFAFAFRGGADFVVAGMFDFQLGEDVNIARGILAKLDTRDRPWRA